MTDSLPPQAENEKLRSGLEAGLNTYIRTITPENSLAEYGDSEDSIYSKETLEVLGVADASVDEQLMALEAGLKTVLDEFSAASGVRVVPFTSEVIQGDTPVIKIDAQRVKRDGMASVEDKLSYIEGVVSYYDGVLDSYIDLLDGKTDRPRLYHTDVVKPGQYVYGSVEQGAESELVFIDLDPEINTIGRRDGESWVIDRNFVVSVVELGAVSAHHPAATYIQEGVVALAQRMLSEGVMDQKQYQSFEYAIEHGETFFAEPEDYDPNHVKF